MNRFAFSLAVMFLPLLLWAQDQQPEPFLENEVSIGIGAGFPLEKDPLNAVGELEVPPSYALNIGYRHYLEHNVAIGVRLYGYINKLSGYTVTDQSNVTTNADFKIETVNIAFEGLMLFSGGNVRPYGFLIAAYASGKLSHDKFGNLSLRGFAGGGGLGLQFEVSQTVAICVEGVGSFGAAKWEKKPFSNSAGDRFNPSVVMALADVLIRFP